MTAHTEYGPKHSAAGRVQRAEERTTCSARHPESFYHRDRVGPSIVEGVRAASTLLCSTLAMSAMDKGSAPATESADAPLPRLGRSIRREWLLEEGMIFLNHGSFGATPRRVLRAQQDWRLALERQPIHFMIDILPAALRTAASELAAFLGATGQDVAFVDNATTGVNSVLRSLRLQPGDEVLTTSHVYPAVGKTISYVCRRTGAVPVHVAVPFPCAGPQEVVDRVVRAMTPRTRLLVIDHITSATALVLPVHELTREARQRGILVLVDGAHAPGMLPLDLPTFATDWYTGNCHKWLCGCKGSAFLWGNPESEAAQSDIHPPVISHFLDENWPAEFDFIGTRDYSPWLSVPEALRFLQDLGGERVMEHNRILARKGALVLQSTLGIAPAAPESMLGSIITLPWPGTETPSDEMAQDLRRALWENHRIELMVLCFDGRLWFRISAHAYNEIDDYERLAEVLQTHLPSRPGVG